MSDLEVLREHLGIRVETRGSLWWVVSSQWSFPVGARKPAEHAAIAILDAYRQGITYARDVVLASFGLGPPEEEPEEWPSELGPIEAPKSSAERRLDGIGDLDNLNEVSTESAHLIENLFKFAAPVEASSSIETAAS